MSGTRTQIYLSERQRKLIDRIAKSEGVSVAEVVGRALDADLISAVEPGDALQESFGALPDVEVPWRDGWPRS